MTKMTKIKKLAFLKASKASVAVVCTAITIQFLSGCAFSPKPAEAQEILTKALSSTTLQPEAGQYMLSEVEEYSVRPSEPSDPFHKPGMRPDLIHIRSWQSGDNKHTLRFQLLNAKSGTVLLDTTQSVVNGEVVRYTHDIVASVEYTVAIPQVTQNSNNTDTNKAETIRREAIERLAQNATVSKFQSPITNKPAFKIISSKVFSADQAPTGTALLEQKPKELKHTYDIDQQTFEILEQSVVAIMSDGSEHLIESRRLISQTIGNLAGLPTDWLKAKSEIKSEETRNFDIRKEVSAGRANEQVQFLPKDRVISVIRGPKTALTQGLQSAAPVWDISSEITLTISGAPIKAWLCEGGVRGVIGSDPIRKVLIFTRDSSLFYITGQSFATNNEFIEASITELEKQ